MTKRQSRKVVGEPAMHDENGDLVRVFRSQRKLTPEEVALYQPSLRGTKPAEITHSVWGRFEDEKLVAFGAYRDETL